MKINLKSKFKFLLFFYLTNLFNVFSQENIQLKSGFNLSSVAISNGSNLDQPSGFVPAFHIGILLNNVLDEEYSFEYGLIYNIKGYKVVDFFGVNVYNYSTYLEVPISLVYNLPSIKNLEIKLGPYFAYAIKESIRNSIMKENIKGKIGNDLDKGHTLKPIDMGLNFGANYYLRNIIFTINLGYGLLNNRPGGGKGNVVKNISSQFSFGYLINFKKNEKIKKK
tara:strand:+ start:1935 stop:2603 length:669 start_codon:yes stop_codon:yes gene_type:complete